MLNRLPGLACALAMAPADREACGPTHRCDPMSVTDRFLIADQIASTADQLAAAQTLTEALQAIVVRRWARFPGPTMPGYPECIVTGASRLSL